MGVDKESRKKILFRIGPVPNSTKECLTDIRCRLEIILSRIKVDTSLIRIILFLIAMGPKKKDKGNDGDALTRIAIVGADKYVYF